MNKIGNCGWCGHKPTISMYFNLRDEKDTTYLIECPHCHHAEVIGMDKNEAIEKWNYLYPSLFQFE